MSRLSKRQIFKISFLLFCFILSFHPTSQSSAKVDNFKIQSLIEGVPILSSLIENKRDVVEFDSSNGKIISISFNIKNLSQKQIFSFYRDFFEEKNWEMDKNLNVWKTKSKRFKKKIFKIEKHKKNILIIKIIIENF